MSSRQLKKLRKQQDLLDLQKQAPDNEEGTSDEEPAPVKPRASAFAGFAALGDQDEENDSEHDEEEEAPEPATDQPAPPTTDTVAAPKKSKKPKKKKKAKKTEVAPAEEKKNKKSKGGLDEIDLALKELKMTTSPQTDAGSSGRNGYNTTLARLLSINYQHLKVINEMRALFGQDTIDSVRATDEAQEQADRRRGRRNGSQHINLETFLKGLPGQKLADVVLKRNPFIQGKETWPKAAAGGLSMAAVTDERVDPTEFTFTHDKDYAATEVQFYQYVNMMDPMQLVHFIHRNPYHVAGLTQVSKVAKNDQNSALAGDLCERALFTFGRVTLSAFRKKLEQGRARINFARPENRQFWLAGYLYIKSLIQKGTYRTALEWVKLYLSISPKDEYSMLNFAHVLAIRSHQAQWFIDLCNSELFTSDDWDLPMKAYHRQTCVLAKLQLDDVDGARNDLVKGMEELPWLYSALFSAINVDVPRSVWGVQPRDDDDALYTELYIHTTKDLWNFPVIVSLLKEAGNLASKIHPRGLPAAQTVPLSVGRFIYLDNTPSLMGLVPPSMLHASPNYDYDPLPPPLEENVISYPMQEYPWQKNRIGASEGDDAAAVFEEHVARVANELRELGIARRAAQGVAHGVVEGDEIRNLPFEEGDETVGILGVLQQYASMLSPFRMMGGARGEGDEGDEDDENEDGEDWERPLSDDGSISSHLNDDDIVRILLGQQEYVPRAHGHSDDEEEDDDDTPDLEPIPYVADRIEEDDDDDDAPSLRRVD